VALASYYTPGESQKTKRKIAFRRENLMRKRFLSTLQFILMLPLVFMFAAIRVKPVTEVADKWAEVTPGRATYYAKEAGAAGAEWESKTVAGAKAYKAAVTSANIESLFAGGVKKAGAAKFERKVKDVGADRFGPGVTAAKIDFSDNVAPFLDEISKITLDARQPRGSTANYGRVQAIGTALHKKRLALRAAGG